MTAKNCGTYFRGISEDDIENVRRFVEALRPRVVIEDLTSGSVALGLRARKTGEGGFERTELGQLMYDAKPYDGTPTGSHRNAGRELAHRMGDFVTSVPLYRAVHGFVAVPSSDPNSKFSLPRGFAAWLAKQTGTEDLSGALTKAHSTSPLKNLARDQKLDALIGSVNIDSEKVRGKSLVIVDDLYQSGLTMNYIAEELREAGAAEVFGLAAVKTLRDDDNLPKASSTSRPDDQGDEDLFS